MGQPNRLPQTNILAFPPARAEDERSRAERSKGAVTDGAPGVAPRRLGSEGGNLTVPLRGGNSREARTRQRAATSVSRHHVEELRSPLIVLSSALRLLAAAIIVLAVLPTLGAAMIFWLGKADALPTNHGGATREVVIIFPSISTRAVLKANPGERVPFPIAIDGTDPVEGLGMIAISRLPAGSTLSAGVPQGETAWELNAGEIDNLLLVLPEAARGELALVIQLLAPNGHVISDAATVVDISTTPDVRVHRVKTKTIPPEVWDQSGQTPEALDAEAEIVSQSETPPPDPVPLPSSPQE
jgi:hypothetical protein